MLLNSVYAKKYFYEELVEIMDRLSKKVADEKKAETDDEDELACRIYAYEHLLEMLEDVDYER